VLVTQTDNHVTLVVSITSFQSNVTSILKMDSNRFIDESAPCVDIVLAPCPFEILQLKYSIIRFRYSDVLLSRLRNIGADSYEDH